MAYLMVKHTVQDFAQWKAVFDSMEAARRAHGSLGSKVYRSSDNPNAVMVLDEYPTLEQAKGWTQDPALKDAMQRAGVASQPEIVFWNRA